MKEYYCCIKEFISSANLAIKSLIIIGFIALAETILTIFFDPNDQNSPTSVSIRSIMSSIFGFIFGTQVTENSNITSKKLQTLLSCIVAIVCLFTCIAIHWLDANQTGASAVEIRNLLFASVGFLLSRAKE
jgi:hypothetical protein